jgi:Rrf2 family protein
MMKMSTKTTYAIRAMIDLARGTSDQPQHLSDIAGRQNIPLPYLEQIFSKLKKAGVVHAVRGPQGGYQLAKKAEDINLADIVSVLEGPLAPVLCSQPQNKSATCHEVDGCMSRLLCNELDGAVFEILSRNTLGTLRGEAERLSRHAVKLNP